MMIRYDTPLHGKTGADRRCLVLSVQVVLFALALILIGLMCGAASAAAPAAGASIANTASATYVPAGYTQQEIVNSNAVLAVVQAVEALRLTQDQTIARTPGAPARFSHLLANTGNTDSTYTLALAPNGAGCPATTFNLSGVKVHLDLNGNGVIDASDPAITLGAAGAIALAPGQAASLLIEGYVPVSSTTGQSCFTLTATADASGNTASNVDVTVVRNAAVLSLTKSVSHAGMVLPGTSTADYSVNVSNIGNQDAMPSGITTDGSTILVDGAPRSLILIRDVIPAGTQYVAGSLHTATPGVLRLFRLPGDPAYYYRTGADDAAAIEVAIGLPLPLVVNGSLSMGFTVRVLSTAPRLIPNTADSDYHDGIDPADERSNTVVIATTPARIGLAKRAGQPMGGVAADGTPDGTVTVPFLLRAYNYGSETLYKVQISDLLEGNGSAFGTYTTATVPAAGEYTIVAGSLRIADLQGAGASAAVDATFTGAGTRTALLAPGATLPPAGEVTIAFSVRFGTAGGAPTRYNTATTDAALTSTGPLEISDQSMNGADPDPDDDGDPSNNAAPTPVSTALPVLSLLKTATPPQRVATDQYEFEYRLTVTNTGTASASNVRLIDNLDCTFGMDLAGTPIQAWQLVGAPTVQSGVLAPATTFTGHAFCDRTALANPNAAASMPTATALVLTDGSRPLAPGQSETVSLRLRVTLKPSAIGTRVQIDNRAWAASLDSNDINVNPGAIVVAVADDVELLLIDPQGVVYNAVTRQPVAGAIVRFTRESCAGGPVTPIVPDEIYYGQTTGLYTFYPDGSVSMVTPASGEYQFYLKSPPIADVCTYRLDVTPPAGSGLIVPSSLIPAQTGTFTACGAVTPNSGAPQGSDPTRYYWRIATGRSGAAGAICEAVHNHIPLDPANTGGAILLQKQGDKDQAELGDFIHYTLTLTNKTGGPLVGMRFVDTLPLGFAYVPGSTRVDDVAMPDPAGSPGRTLTFDYPALTLARDASLTVTYRVRIGVGAPTTGDAVNRARAWSGTQTSNEASWRVHVSGGVFSDDAFLFGKVYLDCNRNREQDSGESGIPGVRLFIEDGTGVVTDSEGKWSLYGLRPITHVLKLDDATLPAGARLEVLDNRNAGRAGSRFVDLRKGEWHKADFAVAGCEQAVADDVKARREQANGRTGAEGEAARARVHLTPDGQPVRIGDARALAASGRITDNGGVQLDQPAVRPLIDAQGVGVGTPMPATATPIPDAFRALAPADVKVAPTGALPEMERAVTASAIPLEQQLRDLDNTLGFIDLEDHDVLPARQLNVRVKGPVGISLRLRVNGDAVPELRVGKRSTLAARNLVAWEYIGIELKPGENQLVLEAVDDFGNVRDQRSIAIVAPDKLAQIDFDVPSNVRIGVPLQIGVRLTDASGVPVTARTAVTVEANAGRWNTPDLNPEEPGLQVFIEGGKQTFELMPPDQPGDGLIRVSAGTTSREVRVAFLPELRPLTGIGIVEARVDFGKRAQGLGVRDAFEAELEHWSQDFDNGKGRASARAALYFKGVIRGDYLLTAAYDSDKASRERLFRDIRPDEYYPVYGDASARTFDAQTTDRAYVRIDKDRSFLMYGDLTTAASPEVRQLSQVNRSLTGVKQHYENDRVRVEAFASHDHLRQKIEEFPANGTSGPYYLKAAGDLFANSEQIEILVRDRNQSSLILSTTRLTRFVDYAIEPTTKRLLFSKPVPSLDPDLNPQSIRVTYEVDGGGPAFWVAGADAQFKAGEHAQLGVAASVDDNPDNARKLVALTGLFKLGEKTSLAAEVVGTRSDDKGDGLGGRIELRHEGRRLKLQAQVAKTNDRFDNPSAAVASGRTEANLRAEYKLGERTQLRGEAVYSDGSGTGDNQRRGASLSVQHRFSQNVSGEVGVRAGNESASPAASFDYGSVSSPSSTTSLSRTTSDEDLFTVRGRITARLPFAPDGRVFVEAEQAVNDADRQVFAAGGDYRINDRLRLYGRHEFISSLTGGYGLNDTQRNNSSVFGIESAYMKTGRAFSEYRLRDGVNGRDAVAALGLRNVFRLGEGLTLSAGMEHTQALGGAEGVESTALTSSIEYTRRDDLKASGGLELRRGDDADTAMLTAGAAWKIDPDWTLLARSVISDSDVKSASGSDRLLARQQIGVAYRPVDQDVWNALARYEYKTERLSGATDEETTTHILSAHLNVQPRRDLWFNARYAGKYSILDADGLRSTYWAHLLAGRMTYDLDDRWDIGLQSALLYGKGGARQWAFGLEGGYRLMPNLWLSAGYNVLGLNDADLADEDYLDRGAYVRLRYKFDETALTRDRAEPAPAAAAPVSMPASVPAPALPPTPVPVSTAAPAPATATPAVDAWPVEMGSMIRFRYGGADREDLTPAALEELTRIATQWKQAQAPGMLVLDFDRIDLPGEDVLSWRLSERRLETIRATLTALGIPADRIRVEVGTAATTAAVDCDGGQGAAADTPCRAGDHRIGDVQQDSHEGGRQ